MLFKIFSYIKFLFKSTNQHGVHSPFVYDFVTKGLYNKNLKNDISIDLDSKIKLSKREEKIFLKIVNYFKIDTILLNNIDSTKTLNRSHNLLFINNLNKFKSVLNQEELITIFIVAQGIHDSKTNYKNWQEIIKVKNATVTIDLFYFGLIFFRKEQQKEHFTIRA